MSDPFTALLREYANGGYPKEAFIGADRPFIPAAANS